MALTLNGVVKKILPEFKTDNFRKVELILTIDPDGQYPQDIPVGFVNAKADVLDPVEPGDVVQIDINLRGREWNERWFLEASAWRINILKKGSGAVTTQSAAEEQIGDPLEDVFGEQPQDGNDGGEPAPF